MWSYLSEFKRLEESAGARIQAFLSVVGEDILDKFAKQSGQNDWQMKIKNYREPINWGLYLTRPEYQGAASFGVSIYYFPEEFDDRMLHISITLVVAARLADKIRQRVKEFEVLNPIKHDWDENRIGRYSSEFYEDWQLQWGQLENWQDIKTYLINRTVEWMVEFTPILEEQIFGNNYN